MGTILLNATCALLVLSFVGCAYPPAASGPRQGEVVVKSPDGRFSGYLTKEPTNNWQRIILKANGCEMEVPVNHVSDQTAEASISLYYIRLPNYPDGRYAAQVIIKRQTRARLDEDVSMTKRILAKPDRDEEDRRFGTWRDIKNHEVLETYDRGILVDYRRDIDCANGDVLQVYGGVHRIGDRGTGTSLFHEMDTVIRRIINSIRPLNVTTNK
jgi:hypothetical protein